MTRMPRNIAVIGLGALCACDRPGPLEPLAGVSSASFPSVLGSWAATGTATLSTWFASDRYSCLATIDVPAQGDSTFSGAVTVLPAGDCGSESGTVAGVVGPDNLDTSVTAMAYAASGATVWQEGATRAGCTLVSATAFTGTLSGDTLAVAGSGAYDCRKFWWTYRVNVDVQITATRT